jgi:FlaA1/EpsC-like NDP-sugar epimerase
MRRGAVMSRDGFIKRMFAEARSWLVNLPRFHKRAALVANDLLLLSLALWLALSFRHLKLYVPESLELGLLFMAAPVVAVAVFFYSGIYRVVTRYIGAKGTTQVLFYLGLSILVWAVIVFLSGIQGVPRTAVVLYWFLASAFIYASRHTAAWLLQGAGFTLLREKVNPTAVAIFGAGQTGLELLEALRRAGDSNVIGFLDTTPSLVGQYIAGVKVYPPEKLASMVSRHGVKCVYLAQSLATRRERAETLNWLQGFPVRVQVLPAIDDLASGRINVGALREVDVEDLLTRDPAPAIAELIDRAAHRKCVLVTGAGGSIGAELVRKLVRQGARKIVLFELAESALYEIDMEVRDLVRRLGGGSLKPEIVAVLGSVHDRALVSQVITAHGVDTICHAAAYKHVPLVEANAVVGLDNNVFGTAVLADVARQRGVERFVLISSDKAVRPTNIMGASKRVSELILQAHASDPACDCIFTIVRFGNVLDSSGSVMRLFRKQIASGGPVTVTHRDVIRYFMSIPEAVELVLQAVGLGSGGEVFVLEMGEPVRIDELARSMIRLAGLECRDDANPTGDVAIEYTGLRPGEKLFEELLIGGHKSPTEHRASCAVTNPTSPPTTLAASWKRFGYR